MPPAFAWLQHLLSVIALGSDLGVWPQFRRNLLAELQQDLEHLEVVFDRRLMERCAAAALREWLEHNGRDVGGNLVQLDLCRGVLVLVGRELVGKCEDRRQRTTCDPVDSTDTNACRCV